MRPGREGGARGEERRAHGDSEPRTHALEESRSRREDRHGDEGGERDGVLEQRPGEHDDRDGRQRREQRCEAA